MALGSLPVRRPKRNDARAYREFYSYGSILRRCVGRPAALKRIAYNVGWRKADPLWECIIRWGLLPYVRPVFEEVLSWDTRGAKCRSPKPETGMTNQARMTE